VFSIDELAEMYPTDYLHLLGALIYLTKTRSKISTAVSLRAMWAVYHFRSVNSYIYCCIFANLRILDWCCLLFHKILILNQDVMVMLVSKSSRINELLWIFMSFESVGSFYSKSGGGSQI
jgi:hypothetical protein